MLFQLTTSLLPVYALSVRHIGDPPLRRRRRCKVWNILLIAVVDVAIVVVVVVSVSYCCVAAADILLRLETGP